MKYKNEYLSGILTIEPKYFGDERGFFLETYQSKRYKEIGIDVNFVQDNQSHSTKNVLRGLHYTINKPQAQLLTVLQGKIFDVVVDLRIDSPTFSNWFGVELEAGKKSQIFMPFGFAHGFCVISETVDLLYKVSEYYDPEDEGGLNWADPTVSIKWPISNPIISSRDAKYSNLK
jgi:dTDP-4-dehydrorhamnose 3,5-epimerase